MLKPDQTYEIVIGPKKGGYHDGTWWFPNYVDKDHQGHWLAEGEAVAVVNAAKMALLMDESRRADQLGVNCDWLIAKIDAIHAALCPGQHGSWQQRAEQAVAAAGKCVKAIQERIDSDAMARHYAKLASAAQKQLNNQNNNMPRSIEDRVKDCVIETLLNNPDQVTPEANIIDDLGADSLDQVELVMSLEEEFACEIADEDAEKLLTVADIVKWLEEQGAK